MWSYRCCWRVWENDSSLFPTHILCLMILHVFSASKLYTLFHHHQVFLPTGQGYFSSRPPPQPHMHQMSCAYCSLQLSLLAVPLGSRQGWGCSSPVTGHCTVLPRLVPDARRNILALGGRKTGPKMSGCWHCPQEDIGHSMSGFTSSRVVGTSCCCQDFKTTAVTT